MTDSIFTLIDTYACKNGATVRLYAVDGGGDMPVHGALHDGRGDWELASWTADGFYRKDKRPTGWDLVKVSSYADWPIDAKVLVWNDGGAHKKNPRYFSGVDGNGNPMTWSDGRTSWSCEDIEVTRWDFAELVEQKTTSCLTDQRAANGFPKSFFCE